MSQFLNKLVFCIVLGFLLKITIVDDWREDGRTRALASENQVEIQSSLP